MARKIQRYGWNPDLPDGRDLLYAAPPEIATALPPKVDLREQCPPVYDQGHLGSCTANSIAGALEFDQMKEKEQPFTPSRLFIYYNERVIEGTVSSDSGAQIRDGVKSVNQLGAPPEDPDWPYDITKFADKPPQKAYDDAAQHKSILYQRLTPTLGQLKGCLASGYPFVFGFVVYESFESPQVASTGEGQLPQAGEQQIGGHAVLAVGYDESQQRFTIRNSWGPGWGMGGYFTLPYPYLLQHTLSSDFWTIRSVK
jgi:C1A family cysteine protease